MPRFFENSIFFFNVHKASFVENSSALTHPVYRHGKKKRFQKKITLRKAPICFVRKRRAVSRSIALLFRWRSNLRTLIPASDEKISPARTAQWRPGACIDYNCGGWCTRPKRGCFWSRLNRTVKISRGFDVHQRCFVSIGNRCIVNPRRGRQLKAIACARLFFFSSRSLTPSRLAASNSRFV